MRTGNFQMQAAVTGLHQCLCPGSDDGPAVMENINTGEADKGYTGTLQLILFHICPLHLKLVQNKTFKGETYQCNVLIMI